MTDNLHHNGTIISIEDRLINVRMTVEGACVSCKVKGVCAAGETQDKVVTLFTDQADHYKVGEEVVVYVTKMMGTKAVLYAYAYPFLLILATLLLLLGLDISETIAGLTSLGVAAVYYITLSLMKDKLEKDIVFKISKI